MFVLLVILLIVVPILELAIIIKVGSSIGVLPTVGLLLLDSLVGAALLRHQGRSSWRRFNDTLSTGQAPTVQVLDGALVIFGGALLLTPGFITDFFGFALLVPPSRAVIRSVIMRFFSRHIVVRAGTAAYTGAGRAGDTWKRRRQARQPYDVDGSAVDVDQPGLKS